MFSALKKGMILGLGVASLTKKKAEKELSQFVKTGKITRKQADVLVGKLMSETEKYTKRLESAVRKELKRAEKEGIRVRKQMFSKTTKPRKKVKKRKK